MQITATPPSRPSIRLTLLWQFRRYLCSDLVSLLADISSSRTTGSTTPAVPQRPSGFGNTPNSASPLRRPVVSPVTLDHPYGLVLSSNFSSYLIPYPFCQFLIILVTGTNCNGPGDQITNPRTHNNIVITWSINNMCGGNPPENSVPST